MQHEYKVCESLVEHERLTSKGDRRQLPCLAFAVWRKTSDVATFVDCAGLKIPFSYWRKGNTLILVAPAQRHEQSSRSFMSTQGESHRESSGSGTAKKERRARRLRIDCRMFFFGENDFEGEARVLDISSGGCCAESSIPVQVGMELRLSVFLSDQRWPVKIEGAVVRWVAEQKFGLEFFKLLPAVQERIRQFIRNHKGEEA